MSLNRSHNGKGTTKKNEGHNGFVWSQRTEVFNDVPGWGKRTTVFDDVPGWGK